MIDLQEFRNDFLRRYGYSPSIFSAPGRVNLIGEHTDYNDGFVLPFAIDKRTYVGCTTRDDGVINVHSRTINEGTTFTPGDSKRQKGWSLYIRGMAEVLKRRGVKIRGADMLIDSDIPFGAGLSSSAALEISVGAALSSMSGKDIDMVDLAFAGQEVEHNYVGVRSGIMDQFASALARAGNALLIDCRSLAFQNIPLPLEGFELLVCDSNVEHELASSEYNTRRAQCEAGVEILQKRFPKIRSLREISEKQLRESKNLLPEDIYKRCRHVVTENARTLLSVEALQDGDHAKVGDLMYESHESLRTDYEVSCEELDFLVEGAAEIDGVLGARMTGGGFGGCTINLLQKEAVESFRSLVSARYRRSFQRETTIFSVTPSDGAKADH